MGFEEAQAHNLPTAEMLREMGFDEGEEFAIPMADFESSDEDEAFVSVKSKAEDIEKHRSTFDTMQEVAPQHNHSERRLFECPDLTKLPDPCSSTAIAYCDMSSVTMEEFHAQFVRPGRPCIIRGVPEACGWRAVQRWKSKEAMIEHYGAVLFKVWEIPAVHGMGKGMPVELPLKLYAEYAGNNEVDSPFYVFQKHFTPQHDELRADYNVPHLFQDDLYNITPLIRKQFPLYRYFVVGGPRTGSNLHTDPHFTSAWNTSLCGHKRWVLFPPGESEEYREKLGMSQLEKQVRQPPGYWWQDVYPKLRASGMAQELGMVEVVQGPGDTIYVPQGWHHVVLNLDWTVAVTQNLIMPAMLPAIWPQLAEKFESFAGVFVRRLRKKRPEVLHMLEEAGVGFSQEDYEETGSDQDEDDHEGFSM